MKLHQIIILLSFATCIPFNFLSMFEPSSTVSFSPTENAYEKNYSQRKSKYDTNSFDAARGLYDDPIYQPKINDAIKAQEIERAQKLASERKETAVTEKQNKSTSPTPAQQELLLQEVALYETTTPPLTNNKTELLNNAPYNATNKTHNNLTFIDNNMNSSEPDTSEMINSQKNNGEIFLSEQVSEQFPQFKKDTSKVSILTDIDTAQEKPGIIAQKVTKEFNRFINNQLFTLIKKTFNLNANLSGAQLSLANIIIKSLAQFAFQLFHIPQHFGTQKDTSINNFKMQIQNLAQQIESYNNKTAYSNPEQMLMLIQFINQFLKENNVIYFGSTMFAKLNTVAKFASTTCDLFKYQNIILASKNAPQAILPFFQSVIENTNNLPNMQFSHQLMHAIYDTNGYMDQILQTWENFKKDDLYKNKLNRQYGAFLTFLLLFENSVVAAAIILDETSELYKVTNPVPVVINIG